MLKIILPSVAASKKDLETVFGLLERIVPNQFQIGIEIIGRCQHFQTQESLELIKQNILSIAKGAYLVLHGFTGQEFYQSGLGDMTTVGGKQILANYCWLARTLSVNYLHLHGGISYQGKAPTGRERSVDIGRIRESFNLIEKQLPDSCRLGIENTTSLAGDLEINPKLVYYDSLFSIDGCLTLVEGTDWKVTFDSCHYAAERSNEVDLVDGLKLIPSNKLGHLHLSDVIGFWKPGVSVWQEGVIPGDGRLGEESFKKLFGFIRENYPDLSFCLEIKNRDYQNPVEFEEGLKRVLSWLG